MQILTLFIIQKSSSTNFNKENVTLTIEQGTLFGEKILNHLDDEVFYNFNGIPYAKPPLGALRFKAPEPADPWIGVYDATQVRPMCPQIFAPALADILALDNLKHSEDCLFLSVHTKMVRINQKLKSKFKKKINFLITCSQVSQNQLWHGYTEVD